MTIPKEHDVRSAILLLGYIATETQSQLRREVLFRQLVSELNESELEIVILCLNRQLSSKYKSITADTVKEVFPTFFREQ